MSSVVLSGDSSGTVTLTVPSAAGTNTATLPAATGTVMVSGNMPAFIAYGNANQTLSNATGTKIAFNTEIYDTNSNYDTSLYRFLPTVAGYYQINANIFFDATSTGVSQVYLRKNGSSYHNGTQIPNNTNSTINSLSCLVYLNGSTDYIEVYGWQNSGGNLAAGSSNSAYQFSGSLVRAA